MNPAPCTWSAAPDGLRIYRGAELVGFIPFDAWGRLIFDMAAHMRAAIKTVA